MIVRWLLMLALVSLIYMVAYQQGFSSGYSLALCTDKSYAEMKNCMGAIR